jgi:hypothetical protein
MTATFTSPKVIQVNVGEEVAWAARDGLEAVEKAHLFKLWGIDHQNVVRPAHSGSQYRLLPSGSKTQIGTEKWRSILVTEGVQGAGPRST